MLLLDSRGHVWALGDPCASGVSLSAGAAELVRPVRVGALSRTRLAKVDCGNGHSVALAANGDVFTWGLVLGRAGTKCAGWLLPDTRRALAGEATDVAAGESHLAVTSITGDTYVWGRNHYGQCAQDPASPGACSFPAPMLAGGELQGYEARRVACGRYHTAVLSSDGSVFTFGAGMSGQLGRAPGACAPWQPARVPLPGPCPALVVQVACGGEHTLCLTDGGRILAFGSGGCGQLGDGSVRSHRAPTWVRTLTGIQEVVAGSDWSLLRCRLGRVYLAGKSSDGGDDGCLLRQGAAPP
mmetsp:Transcript_63634/g.137849  ORF Transcript_63634/g.137849 Transcript_63634/m.137849 type:complete len:298 (+) Transcript_63634:3-896(+)